MGDLDLKRTAITAVKWYAGIGVGVALVRALDAAIRLRKGGVEWGTTAYAVVKGMAIDFPLWPYRAYQDVKSILDAPPGMKLYAVPVVGALALPGIRAAATNGIGAATVEYTRQVGGLGQDVFERRRFGDPIRNSRADFAAERFARFNPNIAQQMPVSPYAQTIARLESFSRLGKTQGLQGRTEEIQSP